MSIRDDWEKFYEDNYLDNIFGKNSRVTPPLRQPVQLSLPFPRNEKQALLAEQMGWNYSLSNKAWKKLKPHDIGNVVEELPSEAEAIAHVFGNGPRIRDTVEQAAATSSKLAREPLSHATKRNLAIGASLLTGYSLIRLLRSTPKPSDYSDVSLFGNGFSGRDDNYNTIEGLKHGGYAQKMRRSMTPFGSGWDPLRNLVAEHLGQGEHVFEQFTRSSSFHEAISSGKVVKNIGQGAFGSADLMKTNVKIGSISHELEYVRKTDLSGEGGPEMIKEALHTRKLSDLNAPNVYMIDNQNRMYMEHFKGESASELMYRGGQIPAAAIDDLESFFKTAHQRGVAHIDAIRDVGLISRTRKAAGEVIPHNVIMTEQGRLGVIDYGTVVDPHTRPQSGLFSSEDSSRTKIFMKSWVGKELPTAADLDMELVAGLRRQKGKLSAKYTDVPAAGDSAATAAGPQVKSEPENFDFFAPKPSSGKISSDPMRKQKMAASQKQATKNLFSNATFGGSRSRSTFAASGVKTR